MPRCCHKFDKVEDRLTLQRLITVGGNTYEGNRSTVIIAPTIDGNMDPESATCLQRLIRPLHMGGEFPIMKTRVQNQADVSVLLQHLLLDPRLTTEQKISMEEVAKLHRESGMYPMVKTIGMNVAHAYNAALECVLRDPALSKYKYVLTYEHDMLPPPTALLELYETIESGKFDAVQALYYERKDTIYLPMAFGLWKPDSEGGGNLSAFLPELGKVYRVNAVAMGFTLWRMDLFKDPLLGPPWFKVVEDWYEPAKHAIRIGQDFYFCLKAGVLGYKFGLDARVLVGHKDLKTQVKFMGPHGGEPRIIEGVANDGGAETNLAVCKPGV